MKYLKTFESIYRKPKIGDFILSKVSVNPFFDKSKEIEKFISNSIGVLRNITNHSTGGFEIEYFPQNEYEQELIDRLMCYQHHKSNIIEVAFDNILNWSENKNELETLINMNKYNL